MPQFGAYHLADNPKLYQPVRTNNFRFVVTGLNNLLRAGLNQGEREQDFIRRGKGTY